ncbi:MAG: hypothetical protein WDN28_32305 [Chthoniobacter sp.]
MEFPIDDFNDVFPGRFSPGYDPKSGQPPKRVGALFPGDSRSDGYEFLRRVAGFFG